MHEDQPRESWSIPGHSCPPTNDDACDALIWPDIPAPQWVDDGLRRVLCAVAGGGTRADPDGPFHWAEGDADAPLGIILDNPGARADANGKPQVCGTRRTLQAALAEAGVDPARVFVTYLFKVRPRRKYDREAAVRVSLPVLRRQVQEGPERRWLALGDRVVGALLRSGGSDDAPMADGAAKPGVRSGAELPKAASAMNGAERIGAGPDRASAAVPSVREMRGKVLTWQGMPLTAGYHPLAARRRPNLLPLLVEDAFRAAHMARTASSRNCSGSG